MKLLLSISVAMMASVLAAPMIGSADSSAGKVDKFATLEEFREKYVDPKHIPKAEERRKKANVDAKVEKLTAQLEKGTGTTTGIGAPPQLTAKMIAFDTKAAIMATRQCQGPNPPHTYPQLIAPPIIIPLGCTTFYRYVGINSGKCIKIFPCGGFCGTCKIVADLVEYYYPTYKVDVSAEPYVSPYLPMGLADAMRRVNDTTMLNAEREIQATMRLAAGGAQGGLFGLLGASGLTSDSFDRQAIKQALTDVQGIPLERRHRSGPFSSVFGRRFYEPINLFAGNLWYVPHRAFFEFYGTDIPPGYGFSKLLGYQPAVSFGKLLKVLAPIAGRRCVRDNMGTGKTPVDVDPLAASRLLSGDASDICVDEVGESFFKSTSARPHLSDTFFQGHHKAQQYVNDVIPKTARQSLRGEDKIRVLRPAALAAETGGQCSVPGALTRENWNFNLTNVREPGVVPQATFQNFTVFKACWGFKRPRSFWTYIVPAPVLHALPPLTYRWE